MKYLIVVILFLSHLSSQAEGIEFFSGTFEQAKAAAQEQGKIIFVDAYAVWCGPCKRMASSVFPDASVGEIYNMHYISMKIDMERGEGLTFREKYPVTAFPTLFYLDADGNILERVVGAQGIDGFKNLGLKHAKSVIPGKNFAAEFEKGSRDPELVYQYLTALNSAKKPTSVVVNEFLKSQPDLNNQFTLQILFDGSVEADSKVFEMMLDNKKKLSEHYTNDEIDEKIRLVALNSVIKAAEYDYPELAEDAKEIVKKHSPGNSKKFNQEADLIYFAAVQNASSFQNVAKEFAKTFGSEPYKLFEAAALAEKNFPKEVKVLTEAETWIAKAVKQESNFRYYHLQALIQEKLGQNAKAKTSAEQALLLAKEKGENTFQIEKLLKSL